MYSVMHVVYIVNSFSKLFCGISAFHIYISKSVGIMYDEGMCTKWEKYVIGLSGI